MKIKLLLSAFFTVCLAYLPAFTLAEAEIVYSLDWQMKMIHYPDQKNKSYSYFELIDLTTGICSSEKSVYDYWCELSFYHSQDNQLARLQRSGFLIPNSLGKAGFIYNIEAGYGNYSRIYSLDLSHKYYQHPALIFYSFAGFSLQTKVKSQNINLDIGGNEYNNLIIDLGLKKKIEKVFYHISLLAMGKDNDYQERMLSINIEGFYDASLIWLYGAASAARIVDASEKYPDREKQTCLVETKLKLNDYLQLGVNYHSTLLDWEQSDYALVALTELTCTKADLNLLYRYEEWFPSNDFHCFQMIMGYNFSASLKASIISSYYFPDTGSEYYEAGLQFQVK